MNGSKFQKNILNNTVAFCLSESNQVWVYDIVGIQQCQPK